MSVAAHVAEEMNTKARLTVYYSTHTKEKVDTIDQILKLFEERTNVLNDKLKYKVRDFFNSSSFYIEWILIWRQCIVEAIYLYVGPVDDPEGWRKGFDVLAVKLEAVQYSLC
jgi:hypothetical protein